MGNIRESLMFFVGAGIGLVQIFLFWYLYKVRKMVCSALNIFNKFDSLVANMLCHQEKMRKEFEEFLKEIEKFKKELEGIIEKEAIREGAEEKETIEKVIEKKGIKVKFGLGKYQ